MKINQAEMETLMCRVRNPPCTAREPPRVGALYKW